MAYNPFPTSSPGPLMPNIAELLYKGVGDLPENYVQGQRNQQELDMMRPIMDPDTGKELDPNSEGASGKAMREIYHRGGANWAAKMMQYLQTKETLDQMRKDPSIRNPDTVTEPPPQPTFGPQTQLMPRQRPVGGAGNPGTGPSQVMTDDQLRARAQVGTNTVQGLVAGARIASNPTMVVSSIAERLGVDPSQELSGATLKRAQLLVSGAASLSPASPALRSPAAQSQRDVAVDNSSIGAPPESNRQVDANAPDGSSTNPNAPGGDATDGASTPERVANMPGGVSGAPGAGPSTGPETASIASGIAPRGLSSTPVTEGAAQRTGSDTAPVRTAQAAPPQTIPGSVAQAPVAQAPTATLPSPPSQQPASLVIPRAYRGREGRYILEQFQRATNLTRYSQVIAQQGNEPLARQIAVEAAQARKRGEDVQNAMLQSGNEAQKAAFELWVKNSTLTDLQRNTASGAEQKKADIDLWKANNTKTNLQKDVESGASGQAKEETDVIKLLGKFTEDGLEAKKHNAALDAIAAAGKNVGYGVIPVIQGFLGKYGVPTEGLTQIQLYQAAINFMAPQLRPEGSGKLLQGELVKFYASLGGLLTTPGGRELAIKNLKLLGEYKDRIGDISSDYSLSPGERMRRIYTLPPPVLDMHVPKETAASAPGTPGEAISSVVQSATQHPPPMHFHSTKELNDARTAGKIKEGDTVTITTREGLRPFTVGPAPNGQ